MADVPASASKSGFFTSEFWVATLGPVVLGAMNNYLGTTLTPEIVATGGIGMVVYIAGRALLKAAALWGWKA